MQVSSNIRITKLHRNKEKKNNTYTCFDRNISNSLRFWTPLVEEMAQSGDSLLRCSYCVTATTVTVTNMIVPEAEQKSETWKALCYNFRQNKLIVQSNAIADTLPWPRRFLMQCILKVIQISTIWQPVEETYRLECWAELVFPWSLRFLLFPKSI